ncbi:MAG TPA: M13 family metallopeptidase [Bacteroidales bacterium]|nr:M13 family metallopeptidase [Bacteroidales bacterium]
MKQFIRFKSAFFILTVFLLATACKPRDNNAVIPIDRANMDFTINPGDDFFRFANGGWLVANPIPDEYSRYGAFEQLRKANDQQLQALISQISSDLQAQHGSNRQRIRDFFNTALDTVAIEENGITPLLPMMQEIGNMATRDDLAKKMADLHLQGIRPLFSIFASQDRKNAEMNIANIAQGGLGMTDRDYYFLNDPRSLEIRAAYEAMIETMFGLAGYDENQRVEARKTIMAIETRLARASMDRVTRRDPRATYNKKSVEQLRRISPTFNWQLYFSELGIAIEDLNVSQPAFFAEMEKLLREHPLEAWRTYLTWNLLRSSAPFLSSAFENASFEFYGRVMTGSLAMQERWRRALSWLNSAMGEAVGQEYVAIHFPPEAKERMLDLVEHLRKGFSKQIDQLTWMSDDTKVQAQKKLASMNVKIGYPDRWIDYSAMNISVQPFVLNVLEGNRFNTRRNLDRIGQPVDRDEWFMSPQTVNAYYSASLNEIVFPAGILQPPFFYLEGDDAVNFGAIGMVIGHEIIHGFDDQGRKFDAAGNLRDWWTPEDSQKFTTLTQVLVDQFNNYVMLDTLTINGRLSLGENIADLGGLTIAFNGLQSKLAETGRPDLIDGFTPEQRFFISYAQIWRNNVRPQELRRQINEGPHSPGEARVNGPVYNMDVFYEAFDIQPGQARFIAPENRARIW